MNLERRLLEGAFKKGWAFIRGLTVFEVCPKVVLKMDERPIISYIFAKAEYTFFSKIL